jgi:putative flippase GtrA
MNLLRKASRYAQVGLLCALLNNAIVIGMDQAGFHYALGVMAGFIIVMLIAYLLHASYTFEVRPSPRGWLTFVGANLSGVPLSMGFMVICATASDSAPLWRCRSPRYCYSRGIFCSRTGCSSRLRGATRKHHKFFGRCSRTHSVGT